MSQFLDKFYWPMLQSHHPTVTASTVSNTRTSKKLTHSR